jgi:hypothetical protein
VTGEWTRKLSDYLGFFCWSLKRPTNLFIFSEVPFSNFPRTVSGQRLIRSTTELEDL